MCLEHISAGSRVPPRRLRNHFVWTPRWNGCLGDIQQHEIGMLSSTRNQTHITWYIESNLSAKICKEDQKGPLDKWILVSNLFTFGTKGLQLIVGQKGILVTWPATHRMNCIWGSIYQRADSISTWAAHYPHIQEMSCAMFTSNDTQIVEIRPILCWWSRYPINIPNEYPIMNCHEYHWISTLSWVKLEDQ